MSDTPRTDAAQLGFAHKVVPVDFARGLELELSEALKAAEFHMRAYLSDWEENEALLEKAGIDFTPDESGGKTIQTAIEELIAERDALRLSGVTVPGARAELSYRLEHRPLPEG